MEIVLFRTNVMILHLSAAHDERLVNQQHQMGSGLSGPAPCRRSQPRGPNQLLHAEAATKEFEALCEFLSDLPDTDARTLASRMYYLEELELSENVSSSDAQTKVSKMFSRISPRTVKRWVTAWEDTGEEALIDHRGFHKGKDKSLLFLSPALVTELKL